MEWGEQEDFEKLVIPITFPQLNLNTNSVN